MLQDSLRVSRGWRTQETSDLRGMSRVDDLQSNQLLLDPGFTRLAMCEEPPSLADLMRPNSTTSFLI